MNKKLHAKILRAYLARLPRQQMELIMEADKESWRASCHLGNNAQIRAQAKFSEVVDNAVESMLHQDMQLIEDVINSVMAEAENEKK